MGWGEGLLLGRIWVGIGIGRNNVVEFVGAPFFSLGVKGQLGTFFSLVCVFGLIVRVISEIFVWWALS